MENNEFRNYRRSRCSGNLETDHIRVRNTKYLNKLKFENEANSFQKTMHHLFSQRNYNHFMIFVLTLNGILLVLSCWKEIDIRYRYSSAVLESLFTCIYTTECVLKMYVHRRRYFDDAGNVLDLLIVVNAATESILFLVQINLSQSSPILFNVHLIIRSMRALRILRLIRYMRNIHIILITCLHSLRELGTIVTLMFLVLVIFAVIGNGLFSNQDRRRFGTFFHSVITLEKVLTLDDWFDIFTELSDKIGGFNVPLIIYLFFYILVEYYTFLSLVIAVLEENFQSTLEKKRLKERDRKQSVTASLYTSGSSSESQSDDTYSVGTIEDEGIQNQSLLNQLSKIRRASQIINDDESGFKEFMTDKHKRLTGSTKLFFQILPSLEASYQKFHDRTSCHDRIVRLIINDLDDIPSGFIGD